MRVTSYYDILGVPRDATTEEIKQAYREIAHAYHPDSNFYAEIIEEPLSEEQEAKFRTITEAYNVLISPAKRSAYDETLAPDLAGWTETELRVPQEKWNFSSQDAGEAVPYAYGTFGNVRNPDAQAAGITRTQTELFVSDIRPVSELITRKRSWVSRFFSFLGL